MSPQRWEQIKSIFEVAIDLDPAHRDAYLDSTCSGDEALRKEVESLLSGDQEVWELLERPAYETAADLLEEEQPALTPGEEVGHYKVVGLLGSGGMGEVYLAQDKSLGREIALKVLPADYLTRDRVQRFRQEARAASALNHPNIVTIYEISQIEGRHFIATEFIEGETLRQRIRRGKLNVSEALDVAVQIASALAAAHRAGIVHRDVKPENMMVRTDGYVKILDFGLAKLIGSQPSVGASESPGDDGLDSSSKLLMGTLRYMSPEQASRLEIDSCSDVFSFGVVLYEMLAGNPPFSGETAGDLTASILKDQPAPLNKQAPEVSEELQRIISKTLEKDKSRRYQTMKELLEDLKHQLEVDRALRHQTDHQIGRLATHTRRKRTVAVTAIAMFICLGVGAAWWVRQHRSQPRLAFQERDWVLITSFENRTGEPLFDGTIEYAIDRELSNSQFVNVAPPERIGDALQLMKKPPDTKVDVALGREVCLRDGAIRALLAGRAEKLGSTYVLSISLIDPATNQVAASADEEAAGQERVAPAVRRLSNWARETLGEALASIRQSNQELEKVTTPSLRALQLYTQGEALLRQKKWPVAEQLFRQALTEDPDFASAHMMLAWSLKNQNKSEDEWKSPSDRALDLAERVSERERYFIQASFFSIRRQDLKAIPIYEALLQRYPDHYWGRNNLFLALRRLCRFQDALPHDRHIADLRPNEFDVQGFAAQLAAVCHHREEALQYAIRANELITPELMKRNPAGAIWITYFLINEPYGRGDLETTLAELDRLSHTVDTRSGAERDAYCIHSARGYLRFGKLRTAESFARKINTPNGPLALALIALTRNDRVGLRKSLVELRNSAVAVPLLIRAGFLAEAQTLISDPAMKEEAFLKVYEGEIALARGQRMHAIPLLQQGIRSAQSSCNWEGFYCGTESLATIYEQQGDLLAALGVLEQACREDELGGEAGNIPRVFWLRDKAHLARLYRRLGRSEDAQKVESELSRLLAYADADHPILVQLRRSQ
jgi:tetratricopeptide (TPR) repeat protein